MKFTLDWLKEHLETNASVEEIADALNRIGLEVEEVINPSQHLKGFVVGEIIEHNKHPDADKLSLLTVSTGDASYQVVCGAPNCRKGLKGIFAKAGLMIPAYNEVLKPAKIRGVESNGMMCSQKELCVGDDHSGIIELSDEAIVGLPAAEVLAVDPVFDISITPNRAECLGVRGIARDLAAAGVGELRKARVDCPPLFDCKLNETALPNQSRIETKFKCPVDVKVEEPKACPVYVGRYIKGVNNKAKTPNWIKDRLTAIGLRSISPVVDITNYVNFDLARPSHAFDADKLKGDVVVRLAKPGEKFVSLEEKEYELDDQSLGICDDDGIQCLGGIMGGLNKGITEDTTNIFLECALFDAANIARTGRKFGIESDSRYRYERWVDPKSNVMGSDYITALILQYCGGEASDIIIRGDETAFKNAVAYISPEGFEKLIGMPIEADKIKEILTKLGFEVSDESGKIKAVSPSWRGDIEGQHDLIEEVVRMIGLDNVPVKSMIEGGKWLKPVLTPAQKRVVDIKHNLAQSMFETVTWSFTDSNIAQYFRTDGVDPIVLSNPIASDLNEMRPSLLPNLLLAIKNNIAKGYANVSLFEVAPEFFGRNPGEQRIMASGVRSGAIGKKAWNQPARAFDVFDVKEDALNAIRAADGPADNLQVTTDAPAYYHPGRSGTLRLGKNVLAYFGEIHPSILKKMGIKQAVQAFEVFVENIPMPRGTQGKAKKALVLSAFQPIDKDLAFVVDKDVPAAQVIAAAKSADKDNITDVRVFDLYEGAGIGEGKKSIGLSLTFQPRDKTYTDQELETLFNKVIESVKVKARGELRG